MNMSIIAESELESETESDTESISLLMRQTNYTREECIEKLKTMTVEDIIKDYLGIIKKEVATSTTNQNIFKAIRDFF
jgi:hypothetical protein